MITEYETVADIVADRDALRKDAERYRWLRDKAVWHGVPNESDEMVWAVRGKDGLNCYPIDGADLDAEIDAAMNGANA